ncbi:MAG: S8 family serine peptidase [Bacteroidota bacterium]
MKTKQSCMFFVILLFIISVTVNAQIKRKIEQVAGKEVKTKIWKGREIQFVRREVAVKIIPSATQTEINKLLETVGGRIINSFDKLGWGLIELPFDKDEILAVDDLLKLPFVAEAEPNMVTIVFLEPNDPYFQGTSPATYPYQWALKNTGQTPPTGTNDADIDAPEAWNISTGNANVIIAVLDSGIPMLNGSLSHPDLDDPNKIIIGRDFIETLPNDTTVRDEYGHGTHVAGIAAAESNNGTGIAGVAWDCKIMVIQVFGAYGSGTFSAFYNGVIYAVDYQRNNPGKKVVINFSGGGGASQQALDAVVYASTYGVPIIASAGNDYSGPVIYPAAYSSSYTNVIAVSSTDATDTFSPFSNQGSQVCVCAPGGYGGYLDGYVYRFNGPAVIGKNIISTTPNYAFNIAVDPSYPGDPYSTDVTQNYGYMPGTSMAAPHVLLCLSWNMTFVKLKFV